MWLEDAGLPNVIPPIELDVTADHWPVSGIDAVFTANSLHIMGQGEVESLNVSVATGICLFDLYRRSRLQ